MSTDGDPQQWPLVATIGEVWPWSEGSWSYNITLVLAADPSDREYDQHDMDAIAERYLKLLDAAIRPDGLSLDEAGVRSREGDHTLDGVLAVITPIEEDGTLFWRDAVARYWSARPRTRNSPTN